ncbi:unnamed protein product [Lepeophtheirus salmonis]|uniref:(salmon louse) hypothetical protein n=1 Tax=Lepeophtheirus salmonis TaxID=72036 RepID=A0A7R8CCU9_LEPSM|nr:unnamed protein product [Lepeophtheirus salmonis]CAF2774869.1 unnamed protein product [Lepeophtheirus salmonis]
MTDAEIEEATERARKAKPIILLDREDAKPLETDDSEIGRNSLRSSKSGVNEPTPSWIQDDEEIDHLSVKKEPNNETNVNAHVNNEIQSSQNDVTNPSDSDKEIHSNNDEKNSDTIEGGGSGDGDGGDSDAASFPKLSSDDPSNNIDDVCLNTPMPCVPEEDDHQDPPSSILAPEEEEEKELIKTSTNASQEEILTPITTGGDPFGSMDTPSQNNEHSDNNNPLYNQHESTNGEEEGRKKSDDNKDDNEISQSEPPPPPVDSTSVDELLRPGEDEEKKKKKLCDDTLWFVPTRSQDPKDAFLGQSRLYFIPGEALSPHGLHHEDPEKFTENFEDYLKFMESKKKKRYGRF